MVFKRFGFESGPGFIHPEEVSDLFFRSVSSEPTDTGVLNEAMPAFSISCLIMPYSRAVWVAIGFTAGIQ